MGMVVCAWPESDLWSEQIYVINRLMQEQEVRARGDGKEE